MTYCNKACNRMLDFRPPRIAMALLLTASLLHLMPMFEALHFRTYAFAGAITCAVGFGIMVRAWWLFKRRDTAICPTGETKALITGDIYAFTRNPMYLGMVMIMLGIALLVGSWPCLAVTVFFALLLSHVFCRYEETKLLHQFGPQYSDYAARVRRWL